MKSEETLRRLLAHLREDREDEEYEEDWERLDSEMDLLSWILEEWKE